MSTQLKAVFNVARLIPTVAAVAFMATAFSCKPKNSSDLKGIVGVAEDGTMRAFALLPMRNLPAVTFEETDNENLQHSINLATKTEYYGFVECTSYHTGNAEDWMHVVEERAANGDLAILANRRLIVTGDKIDAFDGTLPCRVIGRFLATMPELDEVLGSVINNPSKVGIRQFRLAQTVFLSLRGPTTGSDSNEISSLMQRYIDNARAHFGAKNLSAAEMKANLLALDSVFNPCSTEAATLEVPAQAAQWKADNYACVQTSRSGGTEKVYRPGGASGSQYVTVRNLVAAELAYVHLRILQNAKKIDKDLHRLINLLTSTADWTNLKKGSDFYPLAEYLATKQGTSFDFNGIYSRIARNSYKGIALTEGEDEEAGFELYPSLAGSEDDAGFSLAGCGATGGRQTTCSAQQGRTGNKPSAAGSATGTRNTTSPSALIDPQGQGYVEAINRNLSKFIGQPAQTIPSDVASRYAQSSINPALSQLSPADQKLVIDYYRSQGNGATRGPTSGPELNAVNAFAAAQAKVRGNLSQGLASGYGEYSKVQGRLASTAPTTTQELSRQFEVQQAFSNIKSGTRGVTANNKNYEYLGEQGTGSTAYIGLRDSKTGEYHFADKQGHIQSWQPLTGATTAGRSVTDLGIAQKAFEQTNGSSAAIYQQEGSNRFQAVTKVGNDTRETLGIKDGSGAIVAYPTVKTDKSVSIDWKNEAAQQNIVRQLSDTVDKERSVFKSEFIKNNPNAHVSDQTMNSLFKMSNTGLLVENPNEFAKNAKTAGLSDADMTSLGYTKTADGFAGDGQVYKTFYDQKTKVYDPQLNNDIGKMLTASEQQTLGINPATANPDQAIYNAVTDQPGTPGNINLADNTLKLDAQDMQAFEAMTPPQTTVAATPPASTATVPTEPVTAPPADAGATVPPAL